MRPRTCTEARPETRDKLGSSLWKVFFVGHHGEGRHLHRADKGYGYSLPGADPDPCSRVAPSATCRAEKLESPASSSNDGLTALGGRSRRQLGDGSGNEGES